MSTTATIHSATDLDREDLPLIASRTNPWVEVNGEPVDWTDPVWNNQRVVRPQCDTCNGTILPGVIEAMDSNEGIQRCDECDTYPGDLEAAWQLARLVDGVVVYETGEDDEDE